MFCVKCPFITKESLVIDKEIFSIRTIQASDCGLIKPKLTSENIRNQIDLNRPKRIFLFQISIKIIYQNIALFAGFTV